MPVQATDVFLVNRGGVSYRVTAANANSLVQDADLLLVNRNGVSYKITGAAFKASAFQNADLYLVNRAGLSYKATGAEVKAILSKAPIIASVSVVDDSPGGNRFTSSSFTATTTMTDNGTPASSKAIKAFVTGTLAGQMTSTNAITAAPVNISPDWTERTKTGTAIVSYLAASPDRVVGATVSPDAFITSTDGITWTTTTNGVAGTGAPVVCWGNGRWMLARPGHTGKALTSTDGLTWSAIAGLPAGACGNGVAFDGQNWLICHGTETYLSTDNGTTWTAKTTNGANYWRVAGHNGRWVAVYASAAVGSPVGRCSTDGLTWTAITGPAAGRVYAIDHDGQKFVMITGNEIWTSTNAVNWTNTNRTIPYVSARRVIPQGVDKWVVVPFDITLSTVAITHDGGATWIMADTGTAGPFSTVYFRGMQIVGYNAETFVKTTSTFIDATRLTIAGCLTDGFAVGDEVTSVPAGGGPAFIQSLDDTNVIVSRSTGWAVGQRLSTPRTVPNTTLHCTLNSTGTVTGLQSTDPGYTNVTMTGTGPYTQAITFPATLPSGNAPDVDLPAGTTLTVSVQASNTAGTVSATSSAITPA